MTGVISFDGIVYEDIFLITEANTIRFSNKEKNNLGIYLDYPSSGFLSWLETDEEDNIINYKVYSMGTVQRVEAFLNQGIKEEFNEHRNPLLFHGVELNQLQISFRLGFPMVIEPDYQVINTVVSDDKFLKIVKSFEPESTDDSTQEYQLRQLVYIPKQFITNITMKIAGQAKAKPLKNAA